MYFAVFAQYLWLYPIFRWLSLLWNHTIAPAVCEAVIKGSSSPDMSTEGQQKVASTALYVLMQRAVVSGCPLSGQGEL